MTVHYALDQPTGTRAEYRQRIPFAGWIHVSSASVAGVSAWHEGELLGETYLLFPRPEVSATLNAPANACTGFRFFGLTDRAQMGSNLRVQLRAHLKDLPDSHLFAELSVPLHSEDYTDAAYGNLVNPDVLDVHHRRHIYSSGSPAEQPSAECLQLLVDYLPPHASVLDVGCGVGAYARPLRERGHAWMGAEIDGGLLAELNRRKLPHHAIRRPRWPFGYRLPFASGSFDAAIAIEVLEHTTDPDRFLREIRRVVRRRACFSVPNLEVLPFWSRRMILPWHILEGDHRNFFSRFILHRLLSRHFRRVEVIDYGQSPAKTSEGIIIGYHLFAVCEV